MIDLAESDVRAWVRTAVFDPHADVGPWSVVPVDYEHDSPTTGGLFRIAGDGWSMFAKVVRAFRHWPRLDVFPPAARAMALESSVWRYEADLYSSPLRDLLPAGLRMPDVYAIHDLGDDQLLLVLEDVAANDAPWHRLQYERAAYRLGRLDVRLTRARGLPAAARLQPGSLTRLMYESRTRPGAIPALRDDRTWAHPLLRSHRRLRADLDELARRLPDIVDSVEQLPQVRMHGDATPHNLLVPVDRPLTFVVIDWAMGSTGAVGDELGQLLVGRAHDGQLDVGDLPPLHDAVVNAFTAGLAAEGLAVAPADVRYGMDAGLAVRSAFTALPLERLDEPVTDEVAALVARRLELTRYLVDVGLAVPTELTARRVAG